jgi:hypothetical protein
MLRCEIPILSDADRLLYEGLPLLIPVLDELGEGALLIGGLATMAWLSFALQTVKLDAAFVLKAALTRRKRRLVAVGGCASMWVEDRSRSLFVVD